MDTTIDKVRIYEFYEYDLTSLNSPVGDDGESELGDFVENESANSPESCSIKQLACDELEYLMDTTLTERERLVIKMRHGFGDESIHTLGDIADQLGISREGVRQIQKKAQAKLRTAAKAAGLSPSDVS